MGMLLGRLAWLHHQFPNFDAVVIDEQEGLDGRTGRISRDVDKKADSRSLRR